jgi:hypothetical protein
MNVMEKTPKVFISYSWSNSEKVVELAERLMESCGVFVVLDKWDLKAGQDKYTFMEQSVLDSTIDKVLIICDKSYTEKANSRIGGVGDETIIISPEVYDKVNQEKFIPVIFETDENNKPYIPQYIKSRIYFDLSSDEKYEIGFEELLRNIYNKPLYKKPPLGKIPEWLENESVSLSPIRIAIKQIKNFTSGDNDKIKFVIKNTVDSFINTLIEMKDLNITAETLLKKVDELKPVHDLFIDFIDSLVCVGFPIVESITDFFERGYNSIYDIGKVGSYWTNIFEYYDFFMLESFISTAAILLHYEKYKELNNMLQHTYFLRDDIHSSSSISPQNFIIFRKPMETVEYKCKPTSNYPNHFTLTGQILVEREKKPLLTSKSIATADIVLYQLSKILYPNATWYWFPDLYCYSNDVSIMWIKLKSKYYCNKIMPLFGVSNIEKLKEAMVSCEFDKRYKHRNDHFNSAPEILSHIKLEEIASLN